MDMLTRDGVPMIEPTNAMDLFGTLLSVSLVRLERQHVLTSEQSQAIMLEMDKVTELVGTAVASGQDGVKIELGEIANVN